MRNTISFSKKYKKLWGQTKAKLIAVEDINIDDNTSNDLLEYDTKAEDGSYYELKKGQYIQLIFLGDKNIPFCTIRDRCGASAPFLRDYIDKREYYKDKIGKMFNIIIEEEYRDKK